MNRRHYLSSISLAAAFSGCITNSQNTQSEPETNKEPDPSEDIFIFVSNERNEQTEIAITVMTASGAVIAERSTTLNTGETVEVYTGITEPGDYPYTFSLNGEQQFKYTYNVDEFRVQNGLDIAISVGDENIEVSAED